MLVVVDVSDGVAVVSAEVDVDVVVVVVSVEIDVSDGVVVLLEVVDVSDGVVVVSAVVDVDVVVVVVVVVVKSSQKQPAWQTSGVVVDVSHISELLTICSIKIRAVTACHVVILSTPVY